ncbi:hypothetical protein [Ramlibacter albus]|uniref:Uncharacterized protein n=1 Tax=Ramlibacter albus TaxID=2079448 RepID=A0A923MCI6_9BURK|nr:hypothetical protein [Ramlibacter albus]MBC5766547.1 hypothetical protein [Ramlibacter albus]
MFFLGCCKSRKTASHVDKPVGAAQLPSGEGEPLALPRPAAQEVHVASSELLPLTVVVQEPLPEAVESKEAPRPADAGGWPSAGDRAAFLAAANVGAVDKSLHDGIADRMLRRLHGPVLDLSDFEGDAAWFTSCIKPVGWAWLQEQVQRQGARGIATLKLGVCRCGPPARELRALPTLERLSFKVGVENYVLLDDLQETNESSSVSADRGIRLPFRWSSGAAG